MYEDDPQDKVFDVLGEAVFGDHPLGRAIIGRAEVVGGRRRRRCAAASTPRATCPAQRRRRGGRLGRPRRARRARPRRRGRAPRPGRARRCRAPPPDDPPRMRFVAKDTEQYHVCLGAPGIPRDDDRRFALRVLDNILGGTSSSRLFQEVREKRGLAYNVYSFQSMYAGTGQVGLYLGTRPDNVVRAMGVVADELERMRDDPATRRRARALEGERQGPDRAVARVDDGADEPARRVGPRRHAAAERRRGHRAHRRRDARRHRRARARPVRARADERRGHRRPTRRRSAARSSRSRRLWARPSRERRPARRQDPRRRRRRGGADGAGGLRGRRGRRATSTLAARADPALGVELADILGDSTSSSTSPCPRPRSRTRGPACARACTRSSGRPAGTRRSSRGRPAAGRSSSRRTSRSAPC